MKISPQLSRSIAIAATILGNGSNTAVHGCSRVLQNKYDHIIAGRSMDWGFSFEEVLFINPPGQGQEMDGGAGDMSVEWTSKYVSILLCALKLRHRHHLIMHRCIHIILNRSIFAHTSCVSIYRRGSVTSSIIGFFAGYGDLAKEYGTGLGPGEGCEDLVYEKDGGSNGVNSEGLAAHFFECPFWGSLRRRSLSFLVGKLYRRESYCVMCM